MSETVVGFDTEYERDEPLARDIVNTLCEHYPGFGWHVRIKGGGIHIRNLDWSDKWGMFLKTKNVNHDVAVLKRMVVMQAGELLERAWLKAGPNRGQEVTSIEGVPQKHMLP